MNQSAKRWERQWGSLLINQCLQHVIFDLDPKKEKLLISGDGIDSLLTTDGSTAHYRSTPEMTRHSDKLVDSIFHQALKAGTLYQDMLYNTTVVNPVLISLKSVEKTFEGKPPEWLESLSMYFATIDNQTIPIAPWRTAGTFPQCYSSGASQLIKSDENLFFWF